MIPKERWSFQPPQNATELATQAHTETLHQISLSQQDPGAEQAPLQHQGDGDRQHEQGEEETVGGAEGARQTVIPGATQILYLFSSYRHLSNFFMCTLCQERIR